MNKPEFSAEELEILKQNGLGVVGDEPTPPAPPETPPGNDTPPPAPPDPPVNSDTPTIPEGYFDFKTTFEGYESPEAIKERIAKAKEYEEELARVKSEYESVKTGMLPGETETMYRLRMINQKSPDKFELAQGLFTDRMGELDLIKAKLKNSPGTSSLNDDELNRYLSKKYVLSMDGVDPEDEDAVAKRKEQIEDSKLMLKIDAGQAKDELLKSFGEIQIPKAKTPEELKIESDRKATEFVNLWNPFFTGVREADIKVSIPVTGADGSKSDLVSFDIPKEVKEKYLQDLGIAYYKNNVLMDDSSKKSVTDYLKKRFIDENFDTIISTVAQNVRKMSDDEWKKFKFNVSVNQGVDNKNSAGSNKKTTEGEFMKQFNNS